MKSVLALFLAVFLGFSNISARAEENPAPDANRTASSRDDGGDTMDKDYFADYSAIRAIMEQYAESARQGKSEIMQEVFDDNAIMYGAVNGKISSGPIQVLFGGIDSRPPSTDVATEITSIQIHESIANVRVESKNWGGARYSDMFLLIKGDAGWKIIAKIYHRNK